MPSVVEVVDYTAHLHHKVRLSVATPLASNGFFSLSDAQTKYYY